MSDDYRERDLLHATVHTTINYTRGAELREYEVHTNDELADLLMRMRNPQHGEWVYNVDAEYRD
jgi:hypothetical protein